MAIPAAERFRITEMSQEVTVDSKGHVDPFVFHYGYKEKGKAKRKQVKLFTLGLSLNKDLLATETAKQYVCCNEFGDIFEFAIDKVDDKFMLTAGRSSKV